MSRHISTIPQLKTWNRAAEEDPTPEVTNTIDTVDNHLHYQDITNMQIGQICTFIPINIEITIMLVTMIVTNIILLHPLETCVILVITCIMQVIQNE